MFISEIPKTVMDKSLVLAEDSMKKSYTDKISGKVDNQISSICANNKNEGFIKFCQEYAVDHFKNETATTFKGFNERGSLKNIFIKNYFIIFIFKLIVSL